MRNSDRVLPKPSHAAVLAAAIALGQLFVNAAFAGGSVKHVTPHALTFQPFPEERAAQIAMLYGNPAEAGHYIIRLKFAANWEGRPHSHGGTELVTVQSGTCYIAHGDDLSRNAAKKLPAGSFMVLPAGTKMRGFTGEKGCVIDVQGQGPFTTKYLDK